MNKNFKPLLAATLEDTSTLDYSKSFLASEKLDGIRVCIVNGIVLSRSLKPIRSRAVQELFGRPELEGIDAEVLYGDWNDPLVFNKTTSAVMATDLKDSMSKELLALAVFDDFSCDGAYEDRLISAQRKSKGQPQVVVLEQTPIRSEQELRDMEKFVLDKGVEGLMIRDAKARYKQGRSTLKEAIIMKLKRFSDDEAVVVGFEEKLINTNEKLKNELGYSQRSQAQEGMVGGDTLGALVCECKGIRFTMGSGFDDRGRAEVWANKEKYLGKLAKFKHFAIGQKDSYRFPIFQGWRDEDDVS